MTDRELLEFAAKAAGYVLDANWNPNRPGAFTNNWNPLLFDGDALRLVINLKLWLHVEEYGASCRITGGAWRGCEAHLHGGIEAATRRCITQTAAAIGKAMTNSTKE